MSRAAALASLAPIAAALSPLRPLATLVGACPRWAAFAIAPAGAVAPSCPPRLASLGDSGSGFAAALFYVGQKPYI